MGEGIPKQEKIDKRLTAFLQRSSHPFGDPELSLAFRWGRGAVGAARLKQVEEHASQRRIRPAPLSQLRDQLTSRTIGSWTSNWRANPPRGAPKLSSVDRLGGLLLGFLDDGIV
jgi:hypothetical protein